MNMYTMFTYRGYYVPDFDITEDLASRMIVKTSWSLENFDGACAEKPSKPGPRLQRRLVLQA